jgi:flagellar basal-body rod protein FlgC
MIDPLDASLRIAGSGLEVQSTRLRVVAENMANADSTGAVAGADPYRRKTVSFDSALDAATGVNLVQIKAIGTDRAAFRTEYDPSNPAADDKGVVKLPNVNLLMEMADMREANRSYEANLQLFKQTRDLYSMTINLLKGSS